MSAIVIVDTSVLLNILNVPGRNANKEVILAELEDLIDEGDHLFIPMAAIFEVGNHIAQLKKDDGRVRRMVADRFVTEVKKALEGRAPWRPINFPTDDEVWGWLDGFPDAAMQGIGMADQAIRHEWHDQCAKNPSRRVRVWSLDNHLAALDRTV